MAWTLKQFKDSLALWRRREKVRKNLHTTAQKDLMDARAQDIHPRQHLVDRRDLRSKQLAEARENIARREKQIAELTAPPMRERAYQEAVKLVGVMESGGNNRGRDVEKIIVEGGGIPGDAWCGWFLATVYKRARSKSVTREWGAVRLYDRIKGLTRVTKPLRGDIVRFNFDHVGLFVKDNGNGTIETIEGNTGVTGAVSDSKTGGDGVYRKTRSKSLVLDYWHVTA